jgi:hypothetical protein
MRGVFTVISRTRASAAAVAAGLSLIILTGSGLAAAPKVVHYDAANMAQYGSMWSNLYGLGEMALGDTRSITDGRFSVSAVPFQTASDYSVFDHLKYIAVSNQSFDVPAKGSLEFSVDIKASTPGTEDGRVIHGCYGAPGSYLHVGDACDRPWSATALQGQQAGVVLNMINFQTGQLFDWFVAGDTAFALIERLPSEVTGNPGVGLGKAYTQIVKQVKIKPGVTHTVSIEYSRRPNGSAVKYSIDGATVANIKHVGVPLDVQGVKFTGIYPSLGSGEELVDDIDSFVIGHGLFSLLDAFPFQHPDAPDLSVSIPVGQRAFGQGASGTFSNFTVTTKGD